MTGLRVDGRCISVYGDLNFESVCSLYDSAVCVLDKMRADCVDFHFSGVTASNSAGLCFLTRLLRLSYKRGQSIRFTALPQQLYDLVCLSQLDHILPIEPSGGVKRCEKS